MPSFRLNAAAAVVLSALAFHATQAHAQGTPLKLQKSVGEAPPSEDVPTFIEADRLEGVSEGEMEASGNAEVRRGPTTLKADHIRYWQETDEVEATGNVHLLNQGNEVTGPRLRMRLNDNVGIFDDPVFKLAPRVVTDEDDLRGERIKVDRASSQVIENRGDARAFRFEGDDQYRVTDGRVTSCRPGQDDWYVRADEMRIDMQREVVTAYGASLSFLGMETPEVPWFEFPLNNARKTGFLPPTLGLSSRNGAEAALPFYWNIAPNYDATITPRYMEKRGVQLLTEARYLQPRHRGQIRYEFLPSDDQEGDERWGIAIRQTTLLRGWWGEINYNKVSDDDYFRDLSNRLSVATQDHLRQEGFVRYAGVPWWNAMARIQKFQTLENPDKNISVPYERVPQLTFNALNQDFRYLDLGMESEFVSFIHPTAVEGRRTIAYPSIAVPIRGSSAYIKPKIGVHATWYNMSQGADDPDRDDRTPSRYVPIYSVDSGVAFERETNWLGRDWVQTLEPRLYYLRVPFRDQSELPGFDTALADLNFGQIFSENIFTGGDRIAEANQITAAVTTRLIEPGTGQEIVRALIGQRFYFNDQRVSLPDGTGERTSSESSLLAALSGRVARDWSLDTAVQYDVGESELERLNLGVRFSPAPASIANVSYRYTKEGVVDPDAIKSIDVSAQWPLAGRWYGMARLNYDLEGRKMAESLLGIEYNADCWIVRVVFHKFQTSEERSSDIFFVQLELNGFSRIGSNPLETLRRNIPGYTPSNFIDANEANAFDRSELSPWRAESDSAIY
jgi:LPS-assembly protein